MRRSPSGNQRRADRLTGTVIGEHDAESPEVSRKQISKSPSKRRNVSNLQNGVQPLLTNNDQQRNQQEPSDAGNLKKKKVVAKDQRREITPPEPEISPVNR